MKNLTITLEFKDIPDQVMETFNIIGITIPESVVLNEDDVMSTKILAALTHHLSDKQIEEERLLGICVTKNKLDAHLDNLREKVLDPMEMIRRFLKS